MYFEKFEFVLFQFVATLTAYGFSLSPPLEVSYKLSDFDAGMFPPSPLADSGFFLNYLYRGGVKSTVSWVFEDVKFKISEDYDQNWCFPDPA